MSEIEFGIPMPHAVNQVDELSWCLNVFRPSDRAKLRSALATREGRENAFEAIIRYVEKWENSAWIEEYSIERIGRWLRKDAPEDFLSLLMSWANQKKTVARVALRKGLGRELSATLPN